MIVELLCRFTKEISEEELTELKDEIEIQRLVKGDENYGENLIQSKRSYEYASMMVNLQDIMFSNPVDEAHTCIRFYGGSVFTYKINFDEFKSIYQSLLGKVIHDFTSVEELKLISLNGK